ncbi:phage portal protein [Rhodococcus sp. SORGH_AS_0303]|uniref:phage portal protein n=1 Tax=Rhodococcus sp. SORGH_AS_0303 TaxID=3041753 RepID=UPI002788480F|nr:phage portal protein [Rhodococcus sp. SORGH_AS_0303]MDQ1202839.1 HK97 family phage portal protein [Rhodococcus sp. SORGH_AS_0303]
MNIREFFGFGEPAVETRSGSVGSAGGDSPRPAILPPPRSPLYVSPLDALRISAVSRSVDQINTMMSSMPAGSRRNGVVLDRDKDRGAYPTILTRPNLDMDYEEFVQVTVNDLALHGEFFWLRQGDPQTANLVPTSPTEMTVVREQLRDGTWRLKYGHMGREIPRSRVVHKKHTAINGVAHGTGPVQQGQSDLRAALTLADYQQDWFDAGIPSGTLNTDQPLNPDQQDHMQKRWNEFLRSHRGQSVILASGLEYKHLAIKPAEAQMLEVQDAIDRKIARRFGMPAFDLMIPAGTESRTYMNLEQSNLRFLVTTLAKYINAVERGFTEVIPRGQEAFLDESALLRLDSTTQVAVDEKHVAIGLRSTSEIRARDGLRPLPKPKPEESPATPAPGEKEAPAKQEADA